MAPGYHGLFSSARGEQVVGILYCYLDFSLVDELGVSFRLSASSVLVQFVPGDWLGLFVNIWIWLCLPAVHNFLCSDHTI